MGCAFESKSKVLGFKCTYLTLKSDGVRAFFDISSIKGLIVDSPSTNVNHL